MSILNKIFHQCTFDPDKWKKVAETEVSVYVPITTDAYFWASFVDKKSVDSGIKTHTKIPKGIEVTFTNTCLTCGMLHSKTIRY